MNTSIKNIASVIATAIWADGIYDEAEKVTVEEIADALELDANVFKAEIEAQVEVVSAMNEEQTNAYLENAAEGISDEDVVVVYEAAMQMISCDGVISREEIENLLAIADVLGIEAADAVLLIADMVKSESGIVINIED